MGLIALAQGERVESLDFPSGHEIRLKYKPDDLTCPFCGGQVFPRDRQGFILHFVHRTDCTSSLGYHPESPEHLQGKMLLRNYLKHQLKRFSDVSVYLEYPIPNAGDHGRIADVAAVFPFGWILVYECQISPITHDEIKKRTEDYRNAGADVIWFLGDRASTPSVINYLASTQGSVYYLNYDANSPRYRISDIEGFDSEQDDIFE